MAAAGDGNFKEVMQQGKVHSGKIISDAGSKTIWVVRCLFALRPLPHIHLLCFVLHGAKPCRLYSQTLLPSVLQRGLANESSEERRNEEPKAFLPLVFCLEWCIWG